MEWNGVHYNEYRPGAVSWAGRGLGRIFWMLLYYSPFVFAPYLVFRWVDNTPAPWLYVALIASVGALGVFYVVQAGQNRLGRWKREKGGIIPAAVNGMALLLLFALKVWAVEAGSARVLRSWKPGHEMALIIAVVYVLFMLNLNIKRQFYRRRY